MQKKTNLIESQQDKGNTPLAKAVKVRTIKDAKRLMSKLITGFQQGTIAGRDAKDMAYLLTVYLQIVKDFEIEKRIESIEQMLKEQKR